MWKLLLLFLCSIACIEAEESGVHGFLDIEFKNDYITPRGLLVTRTGFTTQILLELNFAICKTEMYELSWIAGVWNDLWSEQDNPHVGAWNELDWYTGLEWIYSKNWDFRLAFTQFLSPPGNFKPENNIEAVLTYREAFNPYIRFFWTVSGDSTVVVGGKTCYVEFGMDPAWHWGSLTLSWPSWISIGPASFWNGGEHALKHECSHFGVFSTGLSLKWPVKLLRSGNWNFALGVQYYYLINDNLLQAQKFTLGISSLKHGHRHVVVPVAGISVNF